jgi:hypothetical protein
VEDDEEYDEDEAAMAGDSKKRKEASEASAAATTAAMRDAVTAAVGELVAPIVERVTALAEEVKELRKEKDAVVEDRLHDLYSDVFRPSQSRRGYRSVDEAVPLSADGQRARDAVQAAQEAATKANGNIDPEDRVGAMVADLGVMMGGRGAQGIGI